MHSSSHSIFTPLSASVHSYVTCPSDLRHPTRGPGSEVIQELFPTIFKWGCMSGTQKLWSWVLRAQTLPSHVTQTAFTSQSRDRRPEFVSTLSVAKFLDSTWLISSLPLREVVLDWMITGHPSVALTAARTDVAQLLLERAERALSALQGASSRCLRCWCWHFCGCTACEGSSSASSSASSPMP